MFSKKSIFKILNREILNGLKNLAHLLDMYKKSETIDNETIRNDPVVMRQRSETGSEMMEILRQTGNETIAENFYFCNGNLAY